MAALTRAMVPLIIKIAFVIDSAIAFPIPRVKTPNRMFPTTLPAVTPIIYLILLVIGLSDTISLTISMAQSV